MPFYNQQFPAYGQPAPDQLSQLRQPYQMQYQPMPQAQPQPEPMIWVQGEAGAKAYMVAPGGSVVLWDAERYAFYIKSADQSGMPSMRVFDYTERTGAVQNVSMANTNQYVTRAEFEQLAARINQLTEEHHGE